MGNQQEIRYAHPTPDRIGEKMIGEDNERALRFGESYSSKSTGSLGNSLRAKAPVYLNGEIVGVVSVGFLVDSIDTIIWGYSKEIWLVLLGVCTAAIIGAVLIAKYRRTCYSDWSLKRFRIYSFKKKRFCIQYMKALLLLIRKTELRWSTPLR